MEEIKVWQIVNGNLELIETSMAEAGRKETEHLQEWIKKYPTILGEDILIIGEQVETKSGGRIDFLAIDRFGNTVIIELKRGEVPRDALAQAIDYASDIASWDADKLSEVCMKFRKSSLEEYLNNNREDFIINRAQRILLVGFSVEESLHRMVEWLSDNYGVGINFIVLKYIKTKNGEEFIARTVIIPEEIEKERTRNRIQIMSDEPGDYDEEELKKKLLEFLRNDTAVPRMIREILLPLCLKNEIVTREMIKKELIDKKEASDGGEAGTLISNVSREIGRKSNDFLRQIINYNKSSNQPDIKENYFLREEKYKRVVEEVLSQIRK